MAKLSYEQRHRLKRSQFAIPEKRSYPIEDESHARNALARVSQHGTPREKSRVRSAVHHRYPGIKCSMCGSHSHQTHQHDGMQHHSSPDGRPGMEIGRHLRIFPPETSRHVADYHKEKQKFHKDVGRTLGRDGDEFGLEPAVTLKDLEL